MGTFIIILTVIVGVLLGLVILVQNPKGGGLATGFQGATQIGGVQKTTDFLEKATWYLGIALFLLCLVSAKYYSGTGVAVNSESEYGDDNVPQQQEQAEGAPQQTVPSDAANPLQNEGGTEGTDGGAE
jgi:preprotein translocase subunit SecG